MITFFSSQHERHTPEYEFLPGRTGPVLRDPGPARLEFVLRALQGRGHDIRSPTVDNRDRIEQHLRRRSARTRVNVLEAFEAWRF